MATLKSIKKRIVSVRNTQKITRAMKMVAAAKLRRAQMAVLGGRPYLNTMRDVVTDIASKVGDQGLNPLFKVREQIKKARVYVFSSNRGLCGGFNSNLLRFLDGFVTNLKKSGIECEIVTIGKKARDFCNVRKIKVHESNTSFADRMTFEEAKSISEKLTQSFLENQVDEVYFIYNSFVSAINQTPVAEKLLPMTVAQKEQSFGIDFLYEPGKAEILDDLLPRYLASLVFNVHKESVASELGARMSAMENATKNASEMIGQLTLRYNRARQAAITTELLDIVNGAESLKG